MERLIKNSSVASVLIVMGILAAVVLAGSVTVREGDLLVDEDASVGQNLDVGGLTSTDGLLAGMPSIQLITNQDFSTADDWNLDGGAWYWDSSGERAAIDAGAGYDTLEPDPAIEVEPGKTYVVSYTIETSGTFTSGFGNVTMGGVEFESWVDQLSTGARTFKITATSYGNLQFGVLSNSVSVYVDDVSVTGYFENKILNSLTVDGTVTFLGAVLGPDGTTGDAPDALVVQGGIGGEESDTGYKGGNVRLTAGAGADPLMVGGDGGDIVLTSGLAGIPISPGGNGGNGGSISIKTTNGAVCQYGYAGKGGDIEIETGNGGSSGIPYSGNGGDIRITTGNGGGTSGPFPAANGGDIVVTAGNGASGYCGGDGGDIQLTPGNGGSGIYPGPSGQVLMNGDADVDGVLTMQTLVLPTAESDPPNPVVGQIYLNTTTGRIKYFEENWHTL